MQQQVEYVGVERTFGLFNHQIADADVGFHQLTYQFTLVNQVIHQALADVFLQFLVAGRHHRHEIFAHPVQDVFHPGDVYVAVQVGTEKSSVVQQIARQNTGARG